MNTKRLVIGLFIIIFGINILIGISLIKFGLGIILIVLGVNMIFGQKREWHFGSKTYSSENFINEVSIFSSLNKVFKSENFRGGKIVLVFSGGEIDLSHVTTSEREIDIEVIAVFSGARIILPKNWKVNSRGVAILGGYDSRIANEETAVATLNLTGVAILGGVEIVD